MKLFVDKANQEGEAFKTTLALVARNVRDALVRFVLRVLFIAVKNNSWKLTTTKLIRSEIQNLSIDF